MGIRKIHDHPTRQGACYKVSSRHPLTKCGLFRVAAGDEIAAGYMVWSGHWYLFDLETGRERSDSITADIFEQFFEPWRIATLEPDPECN